MGQVLNENNPFAEIRIKKILEYAAKQAKRTTAEKAADYQVIDEFQNVWVEARIRAPASKWQRWWWSEDRPDSKVIEEWEPWNRFGEPVNIWRYYKKK